MQVYHMSYLVLIYPLPNFPLCCRLLFLRFYHRLSRLRNPLDNHQLNHPPIHRCIHLYNHLINRPINQRICPPVILRNSLQNNLLISLQNRQQFNLFKVPRRNPRCSHLSSRSTDRQRNHRCNLPPSPRSSHLVYQQTSLSVHLPCNRPLSRLVSLWNAHLLNRQYNRLVSQLFSHRCNRLLNRRASLSDAHRHSPLVSLRLNRQIILLINHLCNLRHNLPSNHLASHL